MSSFIGNLDTIFGIGAWQLLDVAYPVASIAVFLLYGRAKGGLRISALTIVSARNMSSSENLIFPRGDLEGLGGSYRLS